MISLNRSPFRTLQLNPLNLAISHEITSTVCTIMQTCYYNYRYDTASFTCSSVFS